MANYTPKPKGAMALWYKKPEPKKKFVYPSSLSVEKKVSLARAKVNRFREENQKLSKQADDVIWLNLLSQERERAQKDYHKRHMMRSAVTDYSVPEYEEHRIYNEIRKREDEINCEKKDGETDSEVLLRLEEAETRTIVEVLKENWKMIAFKKNSQFEDPALKEARGIVARCRQKDPEMNEMPDEMIWETWVQAEKDRELDMVKNTPEARRVEDILAVHEKRRIKDEIKRRKAEVEAKKGADESEEDTLLRLEEQDEDNIRFALRMDWTERLDQK